MADIFISYAREDKARADQVAQALQGAGYQVFWDSEIPPGQTWSDFIETKLGSCKAVIVLWSETSTKSHWVREEARVGRDYGKLIPARIDASVAPFGFGEVQTADLSVWTGATDDPQWLRMLEAVRTAIARPQNEAPLRQPAMAGAASRPAATTTTEGDKSQAQIAYILYLVSLLVGVTAIVGLVMAYVAKNKDPDWLKSHHIFLIHTFWIGLLYTFLGILLTFVLIGILVLLFALIWWIVRCIQGLDYLNRNQPIPNPRSWFFA